MSKLLVSNSLTLDGVFEGPVKSPAVVKLAEARPVQEYLTNFWLKDPRTTISQGLPLIISYFITLATQSGTTVPQVWPINNPRSLLC